jgi:hypothetical protein
MDRIESLFIQIIAISTITLAALAGLNAMHGSTAAQADVPVVQLERVVVTG